MKRGPVFFDPAGIRRKRITAIAVIASVTALLLTAVFISTVLAVPLLPRVPGISGPRVRRQMPAILPEDPQQGKADFLLSRARSKLLRETEIERSRRPAKMAARSGPIIAGFYVPWEDAGIASLAQNADKITHLFPQWLHLNSTGDGIDFRDWDFTKNLDNPGVIAIAKKHGIRVCPLISNDAEGSFHADWVAKLLSTEERQQLFITQLLAFVQTNHFQGLNLDFENLDDATEAKYIVFVRRLAYRLHGAGLTLSVDLPVSEDPAHARALADLCDAVILMAYDEHYEGGKAGPIASVDFTEAAIRDYLKVVPPDKLVLGVGNYAYDWPEGGAPTESLTYQAALSLAADYRDESPPEKVVKLDPNSLNSFFSYVDENEKKHSVWLLDAVSAYNQVAIGRDNDLRGTALWVLGSEDPSIWSFMGKDRLTADQDSSLLEQVHFPFEVDFEGSGEILSVRATPKDGRRTLTEDPQSGLITNCVYHSYPSSYLIHKSGSSKNEIALTFDDGPDPKYSGPILDYLKQQNVPATFFVIGENAENNPDLVRRMVDEGHEVGSHTFFHPNMGLIGEFRQKLELDATQRAIQSITGRSTILFRPPYNADSEPRNAVEMRPVAFAAKLGYITVGESVDPQDWNLDVTVSGRHVHRTAKDVARLVFDDLHLGNVVLFHDGGGDRSATLGALKLVIPKLRAMGYKFVLTSKLAHLTRAEAMPPLRPQDLVLIGIDRVVFWTAFTVQAILAVAFVIAIALGISRSLIVFPLALVHRFRESRATYDASYHPPVSALIAAYNEEKVIVRTIQSILASDYAVAEVIVVDDGSADHTGDVVRAEFADNPRVHLISQENGGKSSALNHATSLASGEILFCIDADTQLAPGAIGLLVRHFGDPKVGAVAGNVKVGNRDNMVTRWQSVEYITSQNIDRRAYAVMNAVTVVPGAIGAWRKTAVDQAGGYESDTLAEDMDLTWRVRRDGWQIDTDSAAIAYTEAPDTLKGFFRQRFRWAFGTLQCLWKHRRALGRYGWFGRFALPMLWLFQIVFQAIAPLADVQLIWACVNATYLWTLSRSPEGARSTDWQPLSTAMATFHQVAAFYFAFTMVEMICGFLAFRLDREKPGVLWSLLVQRLVYRQVMYGVIYKSFGAALRGARQGWGKLDRTATVRVK